MNKYIALDYIANGIHAANKIHKIRNSKLGEDSRSSVSTSNLQLMDEMLKVITEYSPGKHQRSFEESLGKYSLYRDAYTNLKHHIKTSSRQRIDGGSLVKTIQIIHPLAGSREKPALEKIIKIYEILKS